MEKQLRFQINEREVRQMINREDLSIIRANMREIKELAEKLAEINNNLTKENDRLRELCQMLIDSMILDEPNEALTYFTETMGMTKEELEKFGVNA